MTTAHDERGGEESGHFRPEAWKAAWETAQDVLAPTLEVKSAAERLVWCELLQQTMGWLLLTQIGINLGSFGQLMTQGVCLLSWGIFMLEGMLKFGRSWAHNQFFRDVPCCYVGIHEDAAHSSLALFGLYLISATLLEVSLYVPFLFYVYKFWNDYHKCYQEDNFNSPDCQAGTTRLIEMVSISAIVTILHWVSIVATVWSFHSAMGMGIIVLVQRKAVKSRLSRSSWPRILRSSVKFKTDREDADRLLCLTWWVHMARHRHFGAVVASADSSECGLPGHWFADVVQLKRIVRECCGTKVGDHVELASLGPLQVSQEMALRALVSLAKHLEDGISEQILADKGFDLLVQVVREGKRPECRGLAAAAIAVLATQPTALQRESVELTTAVLPLKRLAWSDDVEVLEFAMAALLNCALNDEKCNAAILSDSIAIGEGGPGGSFLTKLIRHAHTGPTNRCQELAISLLASLVSDSRQARLAVIGDNGGSRPNGISLCIALLEHGLSAQVQASAAGLIAELAYSTKESQSIGSGPYGERCIHALIRGLKGPGDPKIAFASARALCSLAYKSDDNKMIIVRTGGIDGLVELLEARDYEDNSSRGGSSAHRHPGRARFQGLVTSHILEPGRNQTSDDDSLRESSSSKLKDAMDSQPQMRERAQADAARALWMLALHNVENQNLIAGKKAIPLLAKLLENAHPKVHMQAAAALSAVAWENNANQDWIGQEESNVIPRLLTILNDQNEATAEVMLDKVALAIRSLADGNEENRRTFLAHGAKARLEQCIANENLYNKNGRAVRNAMRALITLDKEQC